jgi:hypothetical protein
VECDKGTKLADNFTSKTKTTQKQNDETTDKYLLKMM